MLDGLLHQALRFTITGIDEKGQRGHGSSDCRISLQLVRIDSDKLETYPTVGKDDSLT